MAYCDKCGAYIPDGQTKCLACGYDAEEETKKAAAEKQRAKVNKKTAASGAAAADSSARRSSSAGINNEELRARLEEQRRRQQEQSRIWAERERERREQSRAQQENARREWESRSENYNGDYSGAGYSGSSGGMDFSRGSQSYFEKDSKLFALLSYFSFLSFIPIFFRRNDDFALFHAKQGLILLIYGVVADVLSAIPVVGWMFPLFRVYCVISGVSAAAKGQRRLLPYIGRFAEYFKF